MKTKVSTVKDSGASASIISWDLAKTLNMMVFDTGDATLKDESHKHIEVRSRGEITVHDEGEARLDKTGD